MQGAAGYPNRFNSARFGKMTPKSSRSSHVFGRALVAGRIKNSRNVHTLLSVGFVADLDSRVGNDEYHNG